MLLISVHDKVAGSWSPPSVVPNKQAAVRDFRTATQNPQTVIGQHPDDFELYVIGEWLTPYDTSKLPTLTGFDKFEFVECGISKTED